MKIKINKKALALLVGTSLVLTSQKTKSQIFDAGATMNANTTVNIRLSNTTESQIIGQINQHNTATRIFSCDNGWDLIKYKDKIYHFAMNGQTGKLIGDIPLDKKRVFLFSILIFIITFILSLIFVLITGVR